MPYKKANTAKKSKIVISPKLIPPKLKSSGRRWIRSEMDKRFIPPKLPSRHLSSNDAPCCKYIGQYQHFDFRYCTAVRSMIKFSSLGSYDISGLDEFKQFLRCLIQTHIAVSSDKVKSVTGVSSLDLDGKVKRMISKGATFGDFIGHDDGGGVTLIFPFYSFWAKVKN